MIEKILRLTDEMIRQLDQCASLDELPDTIRAGRFLGPIRSRHDPATGWHSLATADIPAGTIVSLMEGTRTDRPWRYSCQVGPGLHVLGPPYINHVCEDPNLRVDTRAIRLVAMRDISAGEELTLNYLSFETRMRNPFDCQCGRSRCFGRVAGYQLLDAGQQSQLAAELELPEYLLDAALAIRSRPM